MRWCGRSGSRRALAWQLRLDVRYPISGSSWGGRRKPETPREAWVPLSWAVVVVCTGNQRRGPPPQSVCPVMGALALAPFVGSEERRLCLRAPLSWLYWWIQRLYSSARRVQLLEPAGCGGSCGRWEWWWLWRHCWQNCPQCQLPLRWEGG